MQRFTYDILHDVTEDTEIIQSQETVRSIQLPAYATDQQRRELFFEVVEGLDEVSFTAQRLRLDVGKDFLTLRRELGGGWIPQENDDDAFQVTQSMTGVMNELNTAINEELEELRKNQNEKD
jgi:hypothetical protein